MKFDLHSNLVRDSFWLCDLRLCQLRMLNDVRFQWLMLVPRRPDVTEWFDLTPPDQHQLHIETSALAKLLKQITTCDKINIGALGNVVPQLHVHIIARHKNDPCWPAPVWGTTMISMTKAQCHERSACVMTAVRTDLSEYLQRD